MATLLYKGVPSNPENGLRVRLGYSVHTLSGSFTVTNQDAQFLALDPDGAGRNVVMPSEAASQGSFFYIKNEAGATHALTIRNSADDSSVGTIDATKGHFVVCNGTAWAVIQ